MFRPTSDPIKGRFLRAPISAIFLFGWLAAASAQEPPLDVPKTARLTKPTDVLAVDDWLLYPALRVFSVYSDNFFLSPTTPISALGFGITPSLTAEWTNGIHTTTIYGNAERQIFPTEHDIDTLELTFGEMRFIGRLLAPILRYERAIINLTSKTRSV